MTKFSIDYQEYGQLCDSMSKLSFKAHRLPTPEEIRILTTGQVWHFLGISAWLLEKDGCIPDTTKGASVREDLNDRLDEVMEDMDSQPDEEGKWNVIEYPDYQQLYELTARIGILQKGMFPTEQEVAELFVPNMKFCLGFCMVLLAKNRHLKGKAEYEALRAATDSCYTLHREKKEVILTAKEYENIRAQVKGLPMELDGWWPSMEDVDKIIRPNFSDCFDFVLWLLSKGEGIKTMDGRMVYRELQKMMENNTDLNAERGEAPWL